ncbi:hypothetical protein ACJJTC_005333 [Scirpophaga incertulas]
MECNSGGETGLMMKEDEAINSTGKVNVSGWGKRHSQCVILFFTMTVLYSMRSCMGVALVAMIHRETAHLRQFNHTVIHLNKSVLANLTSKEDTNYTEFKTDGLLNALLLIPPFPEFKWNKKVQDTILASFFWGYMSLQIPVGQLAHRFGARRLLVGASILNFIIPVIFPAATYYGGWICAVLCRVGQGMGQACLVPSVHTILGKWAPLHERGRLTAIIYGGQAIGTVLGLPITGFIGSSYLGWPGIFRFYGFLSGILGVVVWLMVVDTPAKHQSISLAEKRYIEGSLGPTTETKMPVPWKQIFKCRGMYAITAAHIGNAWGQLTLFTEIPSYMDKIMGVNIKANGLLTALPFMVMWFTNFFFSWLTDMLIAKKYLTVTQTRKLANSIGSIPASILLILLAYAPKNIYIVESLLVAICSFKVASHVGFHVNHVDIAPNFAGTLISMSNFLSQAIASLAPITAGIILTDTSDPVLWRKVFFVSAGLYFFTNLVYVILGTAELADWNSPRYEKVALNDNNKGDKANVKSDTGEM